MVKQARALRDNKGILGERSTDIRNPKKLTSEVINQIVNFYEDDSNSRLLPGAKDYISIKTVEDRKHIQKRLILCNLSELYQKWIEESNSNDIVKVGLTSFALLRPKHCVLAGKSGTHTVCVCIHHQNPNLMVKAFKNELKLKELMALAVCSLENKECMFHECKNCPGKERIEIKLNDLVGDSANEISYKQWLKTDRYSLETIVKNLDEFLEELTNNLYELTKHHYVSKSQTYYLKQLKENLKANEYIIQMDFAENFSFVIQDEIQASYFSKNQATLHPFIIYTRSLNGNLTLESKCNCIISDNLIHNTEAVFTYVSKIVFILKEEYPNIQKIHYFTDGAGSQYKNRFNLKNLCFHEKDFGLKADWHFFGTAHGKSACDGVGGTVKRVINNLSLQRPIGNQILTPKDMFLVAKESFKNIRYSTLLSKG
ncbi:uncharacterized protein LOC136073616 [Hydra vulgaris]|uniref:uncharacterized protein LOC136073616 n=1 Tax=Hydra vulgaris TaxID=6087 RepID=UPI0032EA0A33